jgi:hypothetical protein
MRGVLGYDLAWSARTAAGQPTQAAVADTLSAGAWRTEVTAKATTDHVTILAPHAGALSVSKVGADERILLDLRMFAALAGDLLLRGTEQPLIARFVFAGQTFADFAPTKATQRQAERTNTPAAQAAAALLQKLRTTPGQRLAVRAGEPIGTVGPAAPVLIRCELLDGSTVPLEFAYRHLFLTDRGLLSAAARGWLEATPPPTAGAVKLRFGAFLDLLVPTDAGDPFAALPHPPASGSVQTTYDVATSGPATLTVDPGMRRFVLPRPAAATTATIGVKVGGIPVPVAAAGNGKQAPSPADTDWELAVLPDEPIALTLATAGKAIRLVEPPVVPKPAGSTTSWDGAVALSGTKLTVKGVSATGKTVTATRGGDVTSFPVKDRRWGGDLTVPDDAGMQTIRFADDAGAATTIAVVPAGITLTQPTGLDPPPTQTEARIVKHDAAGDRRDSLELGAAITDPALFPSALGGAAADYTVDWRLEIRTAVPWIPIRRGCGAGGVRPPGRPHWIRLRFTAAGPGGGRPLASPWDPPPLTPQAEKTSTDSRDDDWVALGLDRLGTTTPGDTPGAWSGNTNAQAGPVCGMARIEATVQKGGTELVRLAPHAFKVTGYNSYAVGWRTFYDHVKGCVDRSFPPVYPLRAALGLSNSELTDLMLAIFHVESKFSHFRFKETVKQNNVEVEKDVYPQVTGTDPAPAEVNFPGLVWVPKITSDSGLGMTVAPHLDEFFDWRANARRAVQILSFPGRNDAAAIRGTIFWSERERLLKEVPAADRPAAEADLRAAKLADYLNVMAPPQGTTMNPKLRSAFVTLYNGWAEPEFTAALVWDPTAKTFVQDPAVQGPVAARTSIAATYKGLVWDDRYMRVKSFFVPPGKTKSGQTIAAVSDFFTAITNAPKPNVP